MVHLALAIPTPLVLAPVQITNLSQICPKMLHTTTGPTFHNQSPISAVHMLTLYILIATNYTKPYCSFFRVTQDGSQTLGESQSIPVASDSLIDSNEPENVNRLIDAVQASDTPYVVVKSEIFPPSDESISPTAASTSETAPVIPPTSTPASPVIVPIAPSPAAQTYTPTASSGPVLIGAIGNSAVGNSAQRATHPSVQRKDLAKEGVIRFFCGGLSFEADEGILSAYFEKYGPVVDVRVAREMGTGRHRGFGFVAVKSPNFDPTASEAVNTAALGELKQQVFADSPHEICARKITVQEENRPGDGSKPPGMKIDGFNEPDEVLPERL